MICPQSNIKHHYIRKNVSLCKFNFHLISRSAWGGRGVDKGELLVNRRVQSATLSPLHHIISNVCNQMKRPLTSHQTGHQLRRGAEIKNCR